MIGAQTRGGYGLATVGRLKGPTIAKSFERCMAPQVERLVLAALEV
jgi:hypothetical protein